MSANVAVVGNQLLGQGHPFTTVVILQELYTLVRELKHTGSAMGEQQCNHSIFQCIIMQTAAVGHTLRGTSRGTGTPACGTRHGTFAKTRHHADVC